MDNIIGQIFLQNCGDSLKVLNKDNVKLGTAILYKCQFLKYPFEKSFTKDSILKGKCLNPEIERIEFLEKEWPQSQGEKIKIIKIIDNKGPHGQRRFLCEFTNYPYKIICLKKDILGGNILNPQIEQVEFIDKLWPQNCGDTLQILEKTNIRAKGQKKFLFRAKFLNYPSEVLVRKDLVINGSIENPNLPWKNKETLKNFILNNFKNKPTLTELGNKLNISLSCICNKINQYKLDEFIEYLYKDSENLIKEYIENILKQKLSSYNTKDYEIDIYIPSLKIGFEYNGDYWHSNLYKEQKYHQEKSLYFQKININIFHIFEWEFLNKEKQIKLYIKSKLGVFDNRIGARQCYIKELNNKEYQDFCNNYHLQGECGAKVKLGLYYKNELIQIMSFGSPRFTSEYEWEIIRECSKGGWCILGGKQKLWSYFLKKYNPKSVISYCDFSKFTGKSYLKLGFKFLRLNKPGFVWFDDKVKNQHIIYERSPWKHKEMKEKGYLQIYDAGQLVFIWEKDKF